MMAPQAGGRQLHVSAVPAPGCPAWTVAPELHACESVRGGFGSEATVLVQQQKTEHQ